MHKTFLLHISRVRHGHGIGGRGRAEVHIQLVVCYYNTTPASKYNWYELSHDRINIAATDKGVFCRLRWWLSIKVLTDSSRKDGGEFVVAGVCCFYILLNAAPPADYGTYGVLLIN